VADDQFMAAVDDSYLLLAFLTRRSVTMDELGQWTFRGYADVVVRIQALVAAGRAISEADRAAFRENFRLLSELARPITIGAIRSYLNGHYGARKADARVVRQA
jgi:hypothetical protein